MGSNTYTARHVCTRPVASGVAEFSVNGNGEALNK